MAFHFQEWETWLSPLSLHLFICSQYTYPFPSEIEFTLILQNLLAFKMLFFLRYKIFAKSKKELELIKLNKNKILFII